MNELKLKILIGGKDAKGDAGSIRILFNNATGVNFLKAGIDTWNQWLEDIQYLFQAKVAVGDEITLEDLNGNQIDSAKIGEAFEEVGHAHA